MDPKDFLLTASNLKDSQNESDVRTSIGRSYYSVFLYLREQLKSLGFEKQCQPNQEAHEFICYSLENCGVKEGSKIGNKIRTLRQERRFADYDLSKLINKNKSCDIYSISCSLIQEFEKLSSDLKGQIIIGAQKSASLKSW